MHRRPCGENELKTQTNVQLHDLTVDKIIYYNSLGTLGRRGKRRPRQGDESGERATIAPKFFTSASLTLD